MKPRKLIKRSAPPRRSTTPTRRSPIKTKKRKPSEFSRIYGSKARVAWVKSLECWWRGPTCQGEIHNAHTITGGMGRKAGYTTILPLCARHHDRFERHRIPFDNALIREAMQYSAASIEDAWRANCARVSQERTPE